MLDWLVDTVLRMRRVCVGFVKLSGGYRKFTVMVESWAHLSQSEMSLNYTAFLRPVRLLSVLTSSAKKAATHNTN